MLVNNNRHLECALVVAVTNAILKHWLGLSMPFVWRPLGIPCNCIYFYICPKLFQLLKKREHLFYKLFPKISCFQRYRLFWKPKQVGIINKHLMKGSGIHQIQRKNIWYEVTVSTLAPYNLKRKFFPRNFDNNKKKGTVAQ